MSARRFVRPILSLALASVVLLFLSGTMTRGLSPGALLDPVDGFYRTARNAQPSANATLRLPALNDDVSIIRDERGVPHIFARSDRDATIALGFVVAQDRLFQLDFIPRVAAGRLAEVLGPAALGTDRFMRSIGMELGAHRNATRILQGEGLERDLVEWYCTGVNAYLDTLPAEDLPFEMRLIGYVPDRCSALQVARVLQYMTYDLTFRTDEADYGTLRAALSASDYEELYPRHPAINEPIIPVAENEPADLSSVVPSSFELPIKAIADLRTGFSSTLEKFGIGYEPGRGSNNWAVAGRRSTTGAPILAGDMHLRVSLPAIWYEAHIVTPEQNLYGVTIPGAPVLVEAFNSRLAWAFTNTGADQIDHIALRLDGNGKRYKAEEGWSDLQLVTDTILVRGSGPEIDTLAFARWGPVVSAAGRAVALRWVGHFESRTLEAIWRMGKARTMDEFESATRLWDAPMQNILVADVAGNVAIRSTGTLPIRPDDEGPGLIDATSAGPLWIGRVPFEELPFAANPAQGFLASANQEPAGDWYTHYLGHDWRNVYRSLRINELLRSTDAHSVDDFKRYQSDVLAVHGRQLVATLAGITCDDPAAETMRQSLAVWDGVMGLDSKRAVAYDIWADALSELVWDEPELRAMRPYRAQLYRLLTGDVNPKWADVVATPERESVSDIQCASLKRASERMTTDDSDWGSVHKIVFRHLLSSDKFEALGRGPFPYPGTSETLSPAGGRLATHSASWRVVVDLSSSPPVGYGVYPGGASGNPFSTFYDLQISSYLSFEHYELHNPESESYFSSHPVSSRLRLTR